MRFRKRNEAERFERTQTPRFVFTPSPDPARRTVQEALVREEQRLMRRLWRRLVTTREEDRPAIVRELVHDAEREMARAESEWRDLDEKIQVQMANMTQVVRDLRAREKGRQLPLSSEAVVNSEFPEAPKP